MGTSTSCYEKNKILQGPSPSAPAHVLIVIGALQIYIDDNDDVAW